MSDQDRLRALVGRRVRLPGHFAGEVTVESARPLGAGAELRVRLPGGELDEAVDAKTMNAQVSVSKGAIGAFCRKHGIRRLAVFGSALRDDFGPTSDIDVLVEFECDRIPGLLSVAGMEEELSRLFLGRKVDLRTPEDLSPYFRQDVLDTAEVQYAQG